MVKDGRKDDQEESDNHRKRRPHAPSIHLQFMRRRLVVLKTCVVNESGNELVESLRVFASG